MEIYPRSQVKVNRAEGIEQIGESIMFVFKLRATPCIKKPNHSNTRKNH